MSLTSWITGWFRFGGLSTGDRTGTQLSQPGSALVESTRPAVPDGALQISAVWACVQVIASIISSLPLFVYQEKGKGLRDLARDSALWALLHDSPNSRMTPMEFWGAMILNLLLRGNAYARIDRSPNGEAYALWPMSADQVEMVVQSDGTVTYYYRIGSDLAVLAEANVLHLKGLGNGTIGLSRLDYMRATVDEVANGQTAANRLFANGGKPTGVLMVDQVLNKDQRDRIKANFEELASGSTSRLFVLEANMKYQQVNMSPNDMQLLTTRQFGVEEVCRWFGVPPHKVMHLLRATFSNIEHQAIEVVVDSVSPWVKRFEDEADYKLFGQNRSSYYTKMNMRALMRGDSAGRATFYKQMFDMGAYSPNRILQLEDENTIGADGDKHLVQLNLTTLERAGEQPAQPEPAPAKGPTPDVDTDDEDVDEDEMSAIQQLQIMAEQGVKCQV